MQNSITFLGTGTSQGVPMIGCQCEVCKSTDSHDKRLRASAYIEYNDIKFTIDAGPDFREQILRENISWLDAVLLTHQHKDHTGGLDDVRAFNYFSQKAFPIYCEKNVEDSLRNEYSYAFSPVRYPGAPEFDIHRIDENPFFIGNNKIVPIRVMHYKLPILGFRIGDLGYITDANYISEGEIDKLRGVKIFVINTIRRQKHISHFSLDEAIEVCKRVGAKKSFLTHLSHQIENHVQLSLSLPPGIYPAYDTLKIDF